MDYNQVTLCGRLTREQMREASKRQKERRRMVYSTPANMKTGETVTFPLTKTRYQRQANGELRRV